MSEPARFSPFAGTNSYVGRTVSRLAAKTAVAGRGRYTDDVALPRMLHAAFPVSYTHLTLPTICSV